MTFDVIFQNKLPSTTDHGIFSGRGVREGMRLGEGIEKGGREGKGVKAQLGHTFFRGVGGRPREAGNFRISF